MKLTPHLRVIVIFELTIPTDFTHYKNDAGIRTMTVAGIYAQDHFLGTILSFGMYKITFVPSFD